LLFHYPTLEYYPFKKNLVKAEGGIGIRSLKGNIAEWGKGITQKENASCPPFIFISKI